MAEQITVECQKGQPCQVDTFGCNGKDPQAPYSLGGAASSAVGNPPTQTEYNALVVLVNKLRSALLANGIGTT